MASYPAQFPCLVSQENIRYAYSSPGLSPLNYFRKISCNSFPQPESNLRCRKGSYANEFVLTSVIDVARYLVRAKLIVFYSLCISLFIACILSLSEQVPNIANLSNQ